MKLKHSIILIMLSATVLIGCAPSGETGQDANQETTAAAPTQEPAPAASQPAAPAAGRSMDPGMPISGSEDAASAQQHTTTGTVTAIDTAQGKITLAHAAVPSLKWPAMTMSFQVEDAATLKALQVGDQVRFTFSKQGDAFVVGEIVKS